MGVSMDGWGELGKAQEKAARREKTKGVNRFNPQKDVEYDIIVLHDQPVVTTEHFLKSEGRSVLCTMRDKGKCRHCGPKSKPSKKWNWLILNRKADVFKKDEDTGEYVQQFQTVKGKKVPKTEPRLQVLGRGQRDAGVLAQKSKKFGGLAMLPMDVVKSGEGTSSAMTFDVRQDERGKLTEAEITLLNGRDEDALRELTYNFVLGIAEDDAPAEVPKTDPEMGEEESWEEGDEAFGDDK